jgi:hypothetical protein
MRHCDGVVPQPPDELIYRSAAPPPSRHGCVLCCSGTSRVREQPPAPVSPARPSALRADAPPTRLHCVAFRMPEPDPAAAGAVARRRGTPAAHYRLRLS